MKRMLYVAMAVLLLSGCRKDPREQERPLYPTVGAINARYSVGDSTTVVFAQGNLQYQPSSRRWRFASNQYDVIGYRNALADTTSSEWIDLFGWGTSGYGSLMPYCLSDSLQDYHCIGSTLAGSPYDWGLFNAIDNGGDKAGQWRTLTYGEWHYLLYERDSAAAKQSLATLTNTDGQGAAVRGLLLLPDKWSMPAGCSFQYDTVPPYSFGLNTYSPSQFNKMQSAGAVFLPAGGYRDSATVAMVGDYGCYWTASGYTDDSAYELYMDDTRYALYPTARHIGHSVRLVQEK